MGFSRRIAVVLLVMLYSVLSATAQNNDYIEQEYYKNAKAKNAAIAAARYAEEGYYYSKFNTFVSAIDSSRTYADTALFFIGRSLMLADTSLSHADDPDHTAIDYLNHGKSRAMKSDEIIRHFYPMTDIKAHHAYGINATLDLSNSVMDFFNASMLLDNGDSTPPQQNAYVPMPFKDEVNRLQADEASFVTLSSKLEDKVRKTERQINYLQASLDSNPPEVKKTKINHWLALLQTEKSESEDHLKRTSHQLESIRQLLDNKYRAEVAKIDTPAEHSTFETGKYNYYNSQKIIMDEELPRGLVYKVQLGYYPKSADKNDFYGLYPITGETISNNTILYYAGLFFDYTDASKGMRYIRKNAVKGAFIVPFLNGQKISSAHAIQIELASHTE